MLSAKTTFSLAQDSQGERAHFSATREKTELGLGFESTTTIFASAGYCRLRKNEDGSLKGVSCSPDSYVQGGNLWENGDGVLQQASEMELWKILQEPLILSQQSSVRLLSRKKVRGCLIPVLLEL